MTSDWVDIDGEESATYTKATCATSDCGKYRCVVSKAGGSTISNEFEVHVFTMEGDYSGGSSWTTYNPVHSGKSDTVGTVTLSLTASSLYEFGIKDNYNNGWYRNTGFIIDNWTKEGFGKGEGNCRLFTGPAGTYTFTLDLYHAGDGTPYVQVSLEYPEVSHPAAGYTYFEKPSEWTNVYLYWYTSDGDRLTDWSGAPELKNTTEICGTTYYYSPLWDKYSYVIYKGNGSNQCPGSGYSTSGCSGKYMDRTDYSNPAWASFSTYTISFAANGGTGSMSNLNGICPNGDQALTENAYEKTGYTFSCWHADVDVTVGESTITAGSDISDEATLKSITSDIALTAQWTANEYDITLAKGEHGAADQSASVVYDATALTSITHVTASGYALTGYYDGETKVLNADGTFAGSAVTGYITDSKWTKAADCTLTAKWAKLNTVTYNANGGSCATSATQESAGEELTLPTPTWDGYTFDGWYNAGTKIGDAGGKYAPTADITLYAKWTDNIAGKLFSYVDGHYGDKYKAFDGTHWVTSGTSETTGDNKTFTNADGVRFIIKNGRYEYKDGIISTFLKYKNNTTTDTIIIPTGKIATVKILYGAYGTGDKYRLTVNGTAQAAPLVKLVDTQKEVTDTLTEVTLTNQTGTLVLTTGGNNIYYGGSNDNRISITDVQRHD